MRDDYVIDYWEEALGEALCDVDKFDSLTSDEKRTVAKALAISAECQSMAFGWDVAGANRSAALKREEDDLRKELRREREKITCQTCSGTGSITTYGPIHSGTTRCWKCDGQGRHDPGR